MTRVIHTGDTHIGYQQYNAPERRRDFLDAFRQVASDAVADDVDAVVHAGDLFHDRRPGLLDLQGTVEVLTTLANAGVPFLAIVGNHESKRDTQWLDLFEALGLATRLGASPTVVGDVAFYGLDFVPRSRREDLGYEFESVPETADHAVLVGHGLFEPFAHADWDTETVLERSSVEFDAVLLGDNHAPDTAEVAETWVTYCGSTERASASERDDRGYNLVTFDEEITIARRGLETRPFVFVDVDLGTAEGLERIRERIREYDVEDAVVIVTVDGEGEPITQAAVEEFAIDRGALIARVNDHREVDEEADLSVSFADPDDAVRERLGELGLSQAAREIDETVRDPTVADANVRETVERRVREALESDEGRFSRTPERETPVRTVADELGDAESASDEHANAEPPSSAGDASTADSSEPDVDSETATDEPPADPADDGQVSMGDFS
ncbi:DNA double-strand break repair protein Mre11 [Natronobiforma cellulositropha]|uniref:DNA double-strand break repair protein Mre11 n=1 Tax=Natronobiforma cellulositropha TaxID=1679076 RepID=UPI0021D5C360|nr:DNA double-strand break repair protein Mre11 [Natronobiforma cellulositropha]